MVAAQKRLEQTPLLEEVFADKTSDPAGQPLEDAAVTFKAAPIQSALVASPSPSPLSDPQTVAFPVWLPDVLQPERPEPPSVPLQSRPTFRTTRKTAKTSAWVWAFGAAVLVFLLGGAAGRFYLLPGNNSTAPTGRIRRTTESTFGYRPSWDDPRISGRRPKGGPSKAEQSERAFLP